MTSSKLNIKSIVLTALFVAIGLVLPQLFHMVPNAGSVILPMHIPVLLCGLTVGGLYGALSGVLCVTLSMLINGMPPLFPVGICMVFELATYGLTAGLGYRLFRCRNNPKMIYAALVTAMLCGRVVNGLAMSLAMGLAGKAYTVQAFLMAAFVTALPGIIIQLVIIPPVVMALSKTKLTTI